MQLRELRLVGPGKEPAHLRFGPGGNAVSGDSDTGKSYMLRCVDFVLGADEMTKKIDEATGYDRVLLEFENDKNEFLTLMRPLGGGDILAYRQRIDAIHNGGHTVAVRRRGKSTAPDVSSLVLPFAGMPNEGKLRSSVEGKTTRLTVRVLLPVFLVDETSIIAERSPVLGEATFDQTARKRMFSYLLTGQDDSGVIAQESRKLVQAGARARLALMEELLGQAEERLRSNDEVPAAPEDLNSTIERLDASIDTLSSAVAEDREKQVRLQHERSEQLNVLQRSETQIIAIDEMLNRYRLLDERYESDLRRLDFLSEGAHFFRDLEDAQCPVCGQVMSVEHRHHLDASANTSGVYEAAKAEAAKILALRKDLAAAVDTLGDKRAGREKENKAAVSRINEIDTTIDTEIAPVLKDNKTQLDTLIQRRVALETIKADRAHVEELRNRKSQLEQDLEKPPSSKKWASLDPTASHRFCREVQALLKEWAWRGGDGQVEFDEKSFDIRVDGKPRQSHGKGVRAILHAAFVIGLLRYCHGNNMPHPGFVLLDSPLTTLKKGQPRLGDEQIDPGIENAFWKSLAQVPAALQIVVLENKEPPPEFVPGITYTLFAGEHARADQRRGFIPVRERLTEALV
jgi:hypothetical protein